MEKLAPFPSASTESIEGCPRVNKESVMPILAEHVHLTVGGVVVYDGGFIHPSSFRELMGEEAYQELLAKPRVICDYDEEA